MFLIFWIFTLWVSCSVLLLIPFWPVTDQRLWTEWIESYSNKNRRSATLESSNWWAKFAICSEFEWWYHFSFVPWEWASWIINRVPQGSIYSLCSFTLLCCCFISLYVEILTLYLSPLNKKFQMYIDFCIWFVLVCWW